MIWGLVRYSPKSQVIQTNQLINQSIITKFPGDMGACTVSNKLTNQSNKSINKLIKFPGDMAGLGWDPSNSQINQLINQSINNFQVSR